MMRIASRVAVAFVVTAGVPVFLLLYVVTIANDATTLYSGSKIKSVARAESYSPEELLRRLQAAEDQNSALRKKLSSFPSASLSCGGFRNDERAAYPGGSKNCLHCSQFEMPLSKCQVIHIAIVCAGYNASRDVVTLLKSILIYRRNLLHLHFVSDSVAQLVIGELMKTWGLSGVRQSFYAIDDFKDRVAWVPNRHYSGVFGLLKLLLPDILPSTLSNVIVLDTDVTFAWDIGELWSLFLLFSSGHGIGAVENLSDWYLGTIWKDHHPWPALGRGFNTGVMLMNLTALRNMGWSSMWRDVTRRQLINYTATQLADQDIINAVSVEHEGLVRMLPCEWNIQLSENAKLTELCPLEKNSVKVIHLNAPHKRRAHNNLADHFRNLYTMFIEYDGKLLRQQPATHGCDLGEEFISGNGSDQNLKVKPQSVARSSTAYDDANDDLCQDFSGEQEVSHRTHLYYIQYEYPAAAAAETAPVANDSHMRQRPLPDEDVTLVAQLSIDRLQTLESLCAHWPGPMSLAVYLSDSDTQHFLQYVQDSEVLNTRHNIGFHVVFRDGKYYPVNRLRNVALRQVQTAFAFLSDIDFLPMHGLYEYLVDAAKMHDLSRQRKALIVPAFETQRYHLSFPATKAELITMLDAGAVSPFRIHIWPKGHAPTNFTLWKAATQPYQVRWQPDFEPYVIVNRNMVAEYDERFVGFGWNKVSHIMELDAQGFAFIVLPNAFIIHLPHAPSFDIAKYRTSATYRRCLRLLKMEFQKDLSRRYGVRALKYLSTD